VALNFGIEARNGRWHVVDILRRVEMAPVFDYQVTAAEVAIKANLGHPFFHQIPTVPYLSVYPRLGQPDVGRIDVAWLAVDASR
jgi:hypothetical protein